jgi:hypothetical protein
MEGIETGAILPIPRLMTAFGCTCQYSSNMERIDSA